MKYKVTFDTPRLSVGTVISMIYSPISTHDNGSANDVPTQGSLGEKLPDFLDTRTQDTRPTAIEMGDSPSKSFSSLLLHSDDQDYNQPKQASSAVDSTKMYGLASERKQVHLSWWQRRQYWANQQWFYELMACAIAAIALAGIVVLLYMYDGKPTPNWPKMITINSAISILTNLLKGAIMFTISSGLSQLKWSWFLRPRQLADICNFDMASRGPWGAMLFLFAKTSSVISLSGALIIVATVTIDPLVQQIVSYDLCTQEIREPATTISRFQSYDDSMNDLALLQRSLVSNVYPSNTELLPRVKLQCSSGNCTFSGKDGYYSTLTWMHECEDITSQVQNKTVVDYNATNPNVYNNYTLPGSLLNIHVDPFIDNSRAFDVSNSKAINGSIFMPNLAALYFNFTPSAGKQFEIEPDPNATNPSGQKPFGMFRGDESVMAVQCSFKPVMKIMNARVASGRLCEEEHASKELELMPDGTVLTAWNERRGYWNAIEDVTTVMETTQELANTTRGHAQSQSRQVFEQFENDGSHSIVEAIPANISYMLSLPQAVQSGEWRACVPTTSATQNNTLRSNIDMSVSPSELRNTSWTYYDPHCLFYVTFNARQLLRDHFEELFSGGGKRIPGLPSSISYKHNGNFGWHSASSISNMHLPPLWNQGRTDMNGVNQYARRVAETISAVLRVAANTTRLENQPATGTTELTKTCAFVTWPWLIPPTLLALCTAVFLSMTILETRRSAKHPNWPGMLKSSPLGLILYAPKEEEFYHYDGPEDMTTVEIFAERITTTLRRRRADVQLCGE